MQTSQEQKTTLNELIDKLAHLDEIDDENFDPAELVGDIKDKVDSIKWKMDQWSQEVDQIKERWIKPMQERIKSLENKKERLKQYVLFVMEYKGFEKLPGSAWEVGLRNTPPAVNLTREPEDADLLDYPGLVEREVIMKWNKAAIKDHLKEGHHFPAATLTQKKTVAFKVKKGS